MIKLLATLIIGALFLLGNISSQIKSFKILDHVAAVHHHDHHDHETTKKNKTPHHHHDAELASLNIQLALTSPEAFSKFNPSQMTEKHSYLSINQLSLLSFSPSIFRPPIA